MAALTKIAKGELARQVLNFKEPEANAGRAVRGRQVLFMFNQHFRTNEELGAPCSVEDLLRGKLSGDDVTSSIHNWDAVITGMSHVPEEITLRDIFLREVRKSTKMKHDLEMYARAEDGTKEHTYHWLIQSVRDLRNR